MAKRTSPRKKLIASLAAVGAAIGAVYTLVKLGADVSSFLKWGFDRLQTPSTGLLVVVIIVLATSFLCAFLLIRSGVVQRGSRAALSLVMFGVLLAAYVVYTLALGEQKTLIIVYEDDIQHYHPARLIVHSLPINGVRISDLPKLEQTGGLTGSIVLTTLERPEKMGSRFKDAVRPDLFISLNEIVVPSPDAPPDLGLCSFSDEISAFVANPRKAEKSNYAIVYERGYEVAQEQLNAALHKANVKSTTFLYEARAFPTILQQSRNPTIFFVGSGLGLKVFEAQAKNTRAPLTIILPSWLRQQVLGRERTKKQDVWTRICLVPASYEKILGADYESWHALATVLLDVSSTARENALADRDKSLIASRLKLDRSMVPVPFE